MTRIFISHSHLDEAIAKKLVEYLLAALKIEDDDIRCTSVAAYMLPPGTNIEEHLKKDINGDIALIGLLTKHGLLSSWVLFELGAAWGRGKKVIPILGRGLKEADLPGPLKNYQPISIEDKRATYSLNEMIKVLAEYLRVSRKYASSEEPKKDEFIQELKASNSHLTDLDVSPQKQVDELEAQLEQERSQASKQQANYQSSVKALQEKLAEKESENSQWQERISRILYEQLPSSDGNAIELKSERGIDYTKLRDLLAAGKWKEADEETSKVMLQSAGKESQRSLDRNSIDNFPREDLRTINQLWLHYSQGKFGFSVQKEIYKIFGGTKEYNEEVWRKFCDRVGWRKGDDWLRYYSDVTFDLNAPPAHLPFLWRSVVGAIWRVCYLLSREDL